MKPIERLIVWGMLGVFGLIGVGCNPVEREVRELERRLTKHRAELDQLSPAERDLWMEQIYLHQQIGKEDEVGFISKYYREQGFQWPPKKRQGRWDTPAAQQVIGGMARESGVTENEMKQLLNDEIERRGLSDWADRGR